MDLGVASPLSLKIAPGQHNNTIMTENIKGWLNIELIKLIFKFKVNYVEIFVNSTVYT